MSPLSQRPVFAALSGGIEGPRRTIHKSALSSPA